MDPIVSGDAGNADNEAREEIGRIKGIKKSDA